MRKRGGRGSRQQGGREMNIARRIAEERRRRKRTKKPEQGGVCARRRSVSKDEERGQGHKEECGQGRKEGERILSRSKEVL